MYKDKKELPPMKLFGPKETRSLEQFVEDGLAEIRGDRKANGVHPMTKHAEEGFRKNLEAAYLRTKSQE